MRGRQVNEQISNQGEEGIMRRGFNQTLLSLPLWMERRNSVLIWSRRGTIGQKYEEMLGNITAVQLNCDWTRRVFWMVGLKTAKHVS